MIDETALRPGIVVGGKFTLLRLIAEGGVGAVYEAEDALVCRRVALKLLRPHYSKHPEIVRRFLREAQATASIDHPNVVTIFELGSSREGTFFIVQELLKGQTCGSASPSATCSAWRRLCLSRCPSRTPSWPRTARASSTGT